MSRCRVSHVDPPKFRIAYTATEDVSIVRYLISSHALSRVKGNQIWKEAAEQKTDPVRSWQSLRNRFFKNIVPNISKYNLLTDAQRQLVLHSCRRSESCGDDEDFVDMKLVSSRSSGSASRSNDPYLCFLRQMEQRDQSIRRRICHNSDQNTVSDGSGSSSSASDTGASVRYSAAEDQVIVQYIVKRIVWSRQTGAQIRLRGLLFWSEMHKSIRISRSAQSLRERFLKRILSRMSDMLPHQPEHAAAIQKLAASSTSS